ncbi:MAG: hypothetical protein U1F29_13490 [Planctomycetota bacterium]
MIPFLAVAVLAAAGPRPVPSAPTSDPVQPAFLGCAASQSATSATSAPRVDEPRTLRFAPAPDTKLARRLELSHELQVAALVQTNARGESQRSTPELGIRTKLELGFVDDVRAVSGGRPVRLRRAFESGLFHLDYGTKGARNRTVADARTLLEGASVVFTWVPEESAWGAYYDGREEAEEVLAFLRADADLLALLPSAPVRADATWDVPAERLVDVFGLGGRIPLTWPKDVDRAMVRTVSFGVGGGLDGVFGGATKGGARATLVRIEPRDGAEFARVALVFDLEAEREREQSDLGRGRAALDEGPVSTLTTQVRWNFRGTGELVWNLTAARAESLSIEGDEKVVASSRPERTGPVRQDLEVAGRLRLAYSIR